MVNPGEVWRLQKRINDLAHDYEITISPVDKKGMESDIVSGIDDLISKAFSTNGNPGDKILVHLLKDHTVEITFERTFMG